MAFCHQLEQINTSVMWIKQYHLPKTSNINKRNQSMQLMISNILVVYFSLTLHTYFHWFEFISFQKLLECLPQKCYGHKGSSNLSWGWKQNTCREQTYQHGNKLFLRVSAVKMLQEVKVLPLATLIAEKLWWISFHRTHNTFFFLFHKY